MNNGEAMDQLMRMDARDREGLLATSTERLLGTIMRLNRKARYHNTLDAIGLASYLMELKQSDRKGSPPLSSPKDTVPS